MNKTIVIVAMIILFNASVCKAEVSLIPPIADGKKTYQEFISSESFPYSMKEDRKNQIISNYDELKLGMSKQEVNSVLEDPDFSTYMHTKENPSKYIGSEWTYYFYKPDPNLVNEKLDIGIFIYFDTKDKAYLIVPKNIDGLDQKGQLSRNGS